MTPKQLSHLFWFFGMFFVSQVLVWSVYALYWCVRSGLPVRGR